MLLTLAPMPDPDVRFDELIATLPPAGRVCASDRRERRLPQGGSALCKNQDPLPHYESGHGLQNPALLKDMNQALEIDLRDDSHCDRNRTGPYPHLSCMKRDDIVDCNLDLSTIMK